MSDIEPREPWPGNRDGKSDEPEILGPEDPHGGSGPRGMGGLHVRILSGADMRKYGMLGCWAMIAALAYALVLLFAAVIGLNDWLGFVGALVGIILAPLLRTSIPIVVGGFLCAYNVWGWGWFFSALFAAPMLVLAVPFLSMNLLRTMIRRRTR